MSLDGLRAWIGEVERKLGMRTRVFLALAVIAIGIGGAAMYLAIDARENSVSESDVQGLQEQLEAQIGEGGGAGTGTDLAQLETELKTLQEQFAQPSGEAGGSGKGKAGGGGGSESGGAAGAGAGGNGEAGGTSGSGTAGGAAGTSGGSKARLGELIQQAKEASEQAEGK